MDFAAQYRANNRIFTEAQVDLAVRQNTNKENLDLLR